MAEAPVDDGALLVSGWIGVTLGTPPCTFGSVVWEVLDSGWIGVPLGTPPCTFGSVVWEVLDSGWIGVTPDTWGTPP